MIKIRPYLDKVTLKNLYFTFVYLYLIYCVEVWGNACDTHLDPIIKIQKKCVRVITFSHYLEPTESPEDSRLQKNGDSETFATDV